MEFSPEDMAYDCPPDTSDPRKFPSIRPGDKEWSRFLNFRKGFAKIDPELRKFFKTDKAVNDALNELLQIKRSIEATFELQPKRKKSA